MVYTLSANRDKETKNTFRYLIEKHEKISGTIYIKKESGVEPKKLIKVKVKI